jgi:hypothetical protein
MCRNELTCQFRTADPSLAGNFDLGKRLSHAASLCPCHINLVQTLYYREFVSATFFFCLKIENVVNEGKIVFVNMMQSKEKYHVTTRVKQAKKKKNKQHG